MASPGLGRLKKGPEFDGVYGEGTVLNGPLFVLRARANEVGRDRWGFAVGKKLAPKAVERNLVRRRLREAARAVEVGVPGADRSERVGADFILTAKAPCLGAPLSAIAIEVSRLVVRARAGLGP